MLQIISSLDEFIQYCHIIILESQDEDTTEWFLHLIAQGSTKKDLIDDMKLNLAIYYKWLGVAQIQEEYNKCQIINDAIEIENKHYINLAQQALGKSIIKESKELNENLKKKYL